MFDLMPFDTSRRSLMRDWENFEKNFFNSFGGSAFQTDIRDRGDRYEIVADLPGYRKEDIHIDVEGDRMTIRAEHSESQEEKEADYIRRERRYGTYCRNFDVSSVKTDQIDASYDNGVLTLVLPKSDSATPPTRRIDIR